jgi:hypothetical protein
VYLSVYKDERGNYGIRGESSPGLEPPAALFSITKVWHVPNVHPSKTCITLVSGVGSFVAN